MNEDERKEAFYAGWAAAMACSEGDVSPGPAYSRWRFGEREGVDPLALMDGG